MHLHFRDLRVNIKYSIAGVDNHKILLLFCICLSLIRIFLKLLTDVPANGTISVSGVQFPLCSAFNHECQECLKVQIVTRFSNLAIFPVWIQKSISLLFWD